MSGAYLFSGSLRPLLVRYFPLPFRFLSSASVLLPATQPLFLPFRLLPVSASQWLPRCTVSALASSVFPVPSRLVSHPFSPGSSYLAFCSFPFVPPGFAPTAVPPVLPFVSAFASLPGFSACFPLSFVRFCSLLTTQPSVLSFPIFPISPDGGSLGAVRFLSSPSLSSSVRPVAMPSFRFRYSASCDFLSPFHCFVSQALTQFPASCFQLGRSPWLSL